MRNHDKAYENEFCLLSSLIDNRDGIAESAEKIRPTDFLKESNKRIYKAILDLFFSGQNVDYETIKIKLNKADDRANLSIINKKSVLINKENLKVFIDAVKQESDLFKVYHLGKKLTDMASSEEANSRDVIGVAENGIVEIVENYSNAEVIESSNAVDEFINFLKVRKSSNDYISVMTGLNRMDEMIGGFLPGELIVIMGKTSNGKSELAMQIAINNMVKQNLGCLIFSLEMSTTVLMQRIFANVSGIPMGALRSKDPLSNEHQKLFEEAIPKVKAMPLYICDDPTVSIYDIQAISKKIKIKHKNLGLVIVDYLQLVDGEGGNKEQEVSGISRGLKKLAGSLKIPVFELSQVSRNFTKRESGKVKIGDARDSGAIEQDGDIVIDTSINHEGGDKFGPKPAILTILKQRNGPTGAIELTHLGKKQMFIDVPFEEYYNGGNN